MDFIYAEGMGMGPDAQAKGIEQAKGQLEPWHSDQDGTLPDVESDNAALGLRCLFWALRRMGPGRSIPQKTATAAADHQADRHQRAQQQGGKPLLGAVGQAR